MILKVVKRLYMESYIISLCADVDVEARRCHSKVVCCNKWLRRMVYNAAARYELIGRYYSGVVSRLCIRSLHAVITVLFHARLNTHGPWLTRL